MARRGGNNSAVTKAPAPPTRLLLPTLVFACLVSAVVSSLGAPLLPAIAAEHHVSGVTAQWALTATLLTGAIATPTMGRLGDGPHRRGVILTAIGIIALGCVLAALPLGFEVFLVGRVMQGLGLGLTPVAIACARDAMDPIRARGAVAVLSITTVSGIGLGYPITGLVAQWGGVAGAYWFGAIVAVVALVTSALVIPRSNIRTKAKLDLPGALLLAVVLCALLLGVSQGTDWGWTSPAVLAMLIGSVVLLAVWIWWELRCKHPLVELRLVRNRSVLTADIAALLAGVGMYLLLSLAVRFVQTPVSTGYGLGAIAVVAGLVLVPFSAMSFIATRITPALARATSHNAVLPIAAVILIGGMAMFSFARGSLLLMFIIMGINGLGVGMIFAVVPGMVLGAVSTEQTASAMGFNQVLRYVGYSVGSAMSGVVLEIHTPEGSAFPDNDGYTITGILACGMWVLSMVVTILLPLRRRARAAEPAISEPAEQLLAEESIADAESFR